MTRAIKVIVEAEICKHGQKSMKNNSEITKQCDAFDFVDKSNK